MSYGSAGAGSAPPLASRVPAAPMGTPIPHIPYPRTRPPLRDLPAGRGDYLCDIITPAQPQINRGPREASAFMAKTAALAHPNLPTTAEQDIDNAEAYTWNAIFLPKDTPDAIVTKLNGAMLEAMHSPLVKERLGGLGAQVVADERATPAYLGQFVKNEIEK